MRTRTLFVLAVGLAGLSGMLSAQAKHAPGEVQRRLVGNWRLVSFESFDEKGSRGPVPTVAAASCTTRTATWPRN